MRFFDQLTENRIGKLLTEGKIDQKSPDEKMALLKTLIQKFTSGLGEPPGVYPGDIRSFKHQILGNTGSVAGIYFRSPVKGPVIIVDKQKFLFDFFDTIWDVLHEVAHFRQEEDWKKMKYKDRDAVLAQFGGPPEIVSHRGEKIYKKLVMSLDADALHQFWYKKYGHAASPHEIDANNFANKNYEAAVNSISRKST